MDNSPADNSPRQPVGLILAIIFFTIYVLLIVFFIPRPISENRQYFFIDEAQRIGTPTNKFDKLLSRMKSDINKNDVEIKVLVGPYFRNFMISGLLVPPDPFSPLKTYLILLDDNLYNKLNPKEQEAMVAHEAGHLLFRSTVLDLEDLIEAQVSADTLAAKYVDPKDFMNFLDKLFVEYITRYKNIEQLIKSR